MHDSSAGNCCVNNVVGSLLRGEVVAIPTDTVYGLAAALQSPAAIERIYRLKRRDPSQPLPILISSRHLLYRFGREAPSAADQVSARFWPGALTIIVYASEEVPAGVLSGGTTVGLRMPANEVTLKVIDRVGGGLAVTSANRSGMAEARTADQVRSVFGNELGCILDGGTLVDQAVSTVLDLTLGRGVILREGAISRKALASVGGVFN